MTTQENVTHRRLLVALLGTMNTNWREGVVRELEANGHTALDNTDPRWLLAKTPKEIAPLIVQDREIMRRADIVIWHCDKDALARTARIELGVLESLCNPVILHVEHGSDPSESYMRAEAEVFPHMHMVETLDEAVSLVQKFSEVKPSFSHQLHALWTSCVNTPGYVKSAWNELNDKMERAIMAHDDAECQRILTDAEALKHRQLGTSSATT